jgi:hypothetical protein
MFDANNSSFNLSINLKGKALSINEISQTQQHLKRFHKSNLSFIVAILVLGMAVTYRAITLDYDKDFELFNISLYIGLWFGLFTGIMIDGNAKQKLQLILVGVIISSSASLFGSMLVMLIIGQPTVWITSMNILACALASMWVLTRYDEVLKGIESTTIVDEKQFAYIRKASSNFEREIFTFTG